jgi:Flp pilus assembly protein TadG
MSPEYSTLGTDRAGVVSVELALLASLVLVPMTLGAIDAGQLVMSRARLDQALHAALFYAWANGGAVTVANVQTIAGSGYGNSSPQPTVTATITQYCIVPATGYPATGTPQQPSNGSCQSGQVVETYLAVNASVIVTLPFTLPFFTSPVTLSVSGRARIQ